MTHVELSCDIRRRHDNSKRLLIPVYLSVKILIVKPLLVQTSLNLGRVVIFFKFLCHLFILLFMCAESSALIKLYLPKTKPSAEK